MSSTPAVAFDYASAPRRALSTTEKNFWKAVALTIVIAAIFSLASWIERNVYHRGHDVRYFTGEGTEAAMRYITIPHIIIGFLFMVSSRNNQTAAKRAWVAGLILIGIALCSVYYSFAVTGGKAFKLAYGSIYLYFLIHELRDEGMFYVVLGDAPHITDKARFKSFTRALVALTLLAVIVIGWSGVPFGLYPRGFLPVDPARSIAFKCLLAFGPIVAWCATARLALAYYARGFVGGVPALVRMHAPLIRLMAGSAAVLGLSMLVTQRAYCLILFHVTSWYIFACYQYAKHPPKVAPTGVWQWMRTTLSGFRVLHIGMVVVLMAIGAVWVFGFNKPPALNWLLAPQAFLYWTIMHITVSFVPR